MRCPECGKWNRDTYPVCYYCGSAFGKTDAAAEPSWQQEMIGKAPGKTYIQVDEEGRESAASDAREDLAREMLDLHARKRRGDIEQQRLRVIGAEQGLAPVERGINGMRGSSNPFSGLERFSDPENADGSRNPAGGRVDYDDYANTTPLPVYASSRHLRSGRYGRKRRGGVSRSVRIAGVILMLVAVIAFGVWAALNLKVCAPDKGETESNTDTEMKTVAEQLFGSEENEQEIEITASILDDMPAHTIRIPAPEGTEVWLGGKVRQSFTSIGGYATAEIKDSIWYEDENGVEDQYVEVVLSPFLRTKAGEQQPMNEIRYTVEVPLSPLVLITPDSGYAETQGDRFTLKFKVDKNATVSINGENYTSFVNTLQDGEVSLPFDIQAIGENTFHIETSCRYYRKNEVIVTIYREPVTIDVHLDSTLNDRSVEKNMTIRGTTLAGANLIVLSHYQNLDLSQMALEGKFSFEAIFDTIGNNDIVIQVSAEGVEPSVYKKTVYYMPPAKDYSKLAWSMNRSYDYNDYLNMTETRVAKTQVYVCTGIIREIITDNPQLAIMELLNTTDANGQNARSVMLENRSTDTWVLGEEYQIYADAYGTYNSMPRLTARYTYKSENGKRK